MSGESGVKRRRCVISDYEGEWRFRASSFCIGFDPASSFSFDSSLNLSVEPSVFEAFPLSGD